MYFCYEYKLFTDYAWNLQVFFILTDNVLYIHIIKFMVLLIAGIFAYLNYLTPKSRSEVLELLVNGLKRLEYRGYDSTGVAIDAPNGKDTVMVKSVGKVKVLEESIAKSTFFMFSSSLL